MCGQPRSHFSVVFSNVSHFWSTLLKRQFPIWGDATNPKKIHTREVSLRGPECYENVANLWKTTRGVVSCAPVFLKHFKKENFFERDHSKTIYQSEAIQEVRGNFIDTLWFSKWLELWKTIQCVKIRPWDSGILHNFAINCDICFLFQSEPRDPESVYAATDDHWRDQTTLIFHFGFSGGCESLESMNPHSIDAPPRLYWTTLPTR